jgi:hypothetical protein
MPFSPVWNIITDHAPSRVPSNVITWIREREQYVSHAQSAGLICAIPVDNDLLAKVVAIFTEQSRSSKETSQAHTDKSTRDY